MSDKFSFQIESSDRRRQFPHKVVIGQSDIETSATVLLKLFAYLLFFRERIQMGVNLHDDTIPYVPDLVQLDYEMRPVLWVECGDCPIAKLDRLAVKVPEAEIWVIARSAEAVAFLVKGMRKAELRQDRYNLLGLDAAMFDEILGLMENRNRVFWVDGGFDPANVQLDFNGLWFDAAFEVVRF